MPSWAVSRTVLKKEVVVAASGYHPLKFKHKGDSQAQRAAVQHTTRQGENWTKASSSLLRRITRLKTVNSDVVLLSTVSLERLSPRGSYHLDGAGMSDTLNQKHLTELLVWSASFVHKQFSKSARKIIYKIRREKPERGTLAAKFWCSSNFRLRKPCKTGKQFGWKRLGGSWVSHIPYRKNEAGTSMSVLTDITGYWWVSLLVPVSSVPPAPPALKGRT